MKARSTHEPIRSKNKGFSLVEALLAVGLFGLLATGLSGVYLYGLESTRLSDMRTRAALLAEEGLEAVRNIRDDDYANLTDGTHGLAESGSNWIFSGSSDSSGIFTRVITIASAGSGRKNVTSTVTWSQTALRGGTVALVSRLTYWMEVVSGMGDWSNPFQSGSFDLSDTDNGRKIQTVGDYVYIVRQGAVNFAIFDISTPDSPTLVGSLSLSGVHYNIAVEGDYAYLATSDNSQEIRVIDISNPNSPSLAGTVNNSGTRNFYGIYVDNGYLYAGRDSAGGDEFYVYSLAVPTAPVLLDSMNIGADVNEIYADGNYAYLATDANNAEVRVIDVSVPAAISSVDTLNLNTNDNAETIDGWGNYLIVGRSTNDGFIHTIDRSTPTNITLVDSYQANDDVRDIDVEETLDYAFVAGDNNSSEFLVLDISNPSNISTLSSVNAPADINGIAYSVDHDRAYGACESNANELLVFAPS